MDKISKKTKKVIADYVILLQRDNKIKLDQVLLFGSAARGQQRESSDVDLAVVSSQFVDSDKLSSLLYLKKMGRMISEDIEPHPLSPADLEDRYYHIGAAVRRDGIRVF